MHQVRKLTALLAVLVGLLWCPTSLHAEPPYGEYEVKAAFLLNFARLVQWPSTAFRDTDTPLVVGILGNDPFGSVLEEVVAGRNAGPRTIQVKRISALADIPSCHLVFVSSPEPAPVQQIVAATDEASVLLVGDGPDFARRGGSINFYADGGKIRFAINRTAAEAAGLKISSRMLRLAKLVPESSSATTRPGALRVSDPADASPTWRRAPEHSESGVDL